MKLEPNLFLIGGMRCGSTSLHHLLSQHPDIAMAEVKEPMYWLAEAERCNGLPETGEGRKYTSPDKYYGLFAGTEAVRWRGEASHYLYAPMVIPTIAEQCPDARFVVSLRDPTERLFSEYLYRLRIGALTGSFEDFAFADTVCDEAGKIVEFGPNSRLRKGRQAYWLKPWLDQFGSGAIKPLLFDNLQKQPLAMARELYSWLDLGSEFEPEVVHTQRSGVPKYPALFRFFDRGGRAIRKVLRQMPPMWRKKLRSYFFSVSLDRPKMMAATEAKLRQFYHDDIVELEHLISKDLSHWRGG